MKMYQPPTKEFFRLFNKIFTIPMTPIEFRLYAYLVCCAGSKGYCWPTHDTIMRDTGIKKSSLQKAIKVLKQRKLIAVYKHRNTYGYSNNEYHLLSLDNPEVYRDLDSEVDELPLFISEELLDQCDAVVEKSGADSRSEFICDAILHYIAVINMKENSRVLTPALESVIGSKIAMTEDRINRIVFKLGVEVAMMNNILASTHNIDPDTMESLRRYCTDEVASIGGKYRLEDTVEFQAG